MFFRGTLSPSVAWLFVSIGLRKAVDVGAHRRRVYDGKPSVQQELWKRAFWVLLVFDRIGSVMLGRTGYLGEEE